MAEKENHAHTTEGQKVDDRRRHSRVDVSLKARFLGENGAEKSCLVINISAGGALLRAKNPPAQEENIVLYVDEVGRFEGKVVRSGKHSFAIDYRARRTKTKRTADALTLLIHKEAGNSERRAAPRIKQDSHATVIMEDGSSLACSILDISLTGASIEIDPKPALGTHITLGKMAAKVVRRHDKGVGVVFTGSAKHTDDAIEQTTKSHPLQSSENGAEIAAGFGKKSTQAR